MYLPLGKSCNKLFDMKYINLNSTMSRKSSNQQIDTCSLLIKLNKSLVIISRFHTIKSILNECYSLGFYLQYYVSIL